jgi:hypothetical protein
MITHDDLIEALQDFYFSTTIDGIDHFWDGDFHSETFDDHSSHPELRIIGAKWLKPIGIGRQYLREWFYNNSEEEILTALKDNLPIKFEITSDFSVNDDDNFKVAEVDVVGTLTIHKILGPKDKDIEIEADIKFTEWSHK